MNCFDRSDCEHVEKYAETMVEKKKKKNSTSHKSMWQFTKVVSDARAKALARKQRTPRAPKAASVSDRKINPQPRDEEPAQRFVPPFAKVWKDMRENRWVVRLKPYGSLSRSWTVYGEIGAFGRCAAWSWHMNGMGGQGACPFPWVQEHEWRSGA